jgi:hypothetical protein
MTATFQFLFALTDFPPRINSTDEFVELRADRGLLPWQLAREEMLSSRLGGLSLARTRLSRDGSVAGLGLFASRNIKEGELITCYPGDALICLEEGSSDGFVYGECTHDVIFGPHVPDSLANPQDCFDAWVDYGIQEDEGYVVIGIPTLNSDVGLSLSARVQPCSICRPLVPRHSSIPLVLSRSLSTSRYFPACVRLLFVADYQT